MQHEKSSLWHVQWASPKGLNFVYAGGIKKMRGPDGSPQREGHGWEWNRDLDRVFACLIRSNPDGFIDRGDKDLAVTDFARLRGLHDG